MQDVALARAFGGRVSVGGGTLETVCRPYTVEVCPSVFSRTTGAQSGVGVRGVYRGSSVDWSEISDGAGVVRPRARVPLHAR